MDFLDFEPAKFPPQLLPSSAIRPSRTGNPPVAFTIPGEARAWARARIRVIPGRGVQHFMDDKTRSYESLVKMAAEGAMRDRVPLLEPLVMSILIRKQPPKSASGIKTRAMLAGEMRPSVKPDLSNLA